MASEKTFGNERDVELKKLDRFLAANLGQDHAVLDIGPWYLGSTKICAKYTKNLDTVDLVSRKRIAHLVRYEYVEDYLFGDFIEYDFVVCVSTLEHMGVTPVKMMNYREMQLLAVEKMLDQALKGVFLSFPYGQEILYKEKYNNIDRSMVDTMEMLARDFKISKNFFNTATPAIPTSWRVISQREADKQANELKDGVSTICILNMLRYKAKGGE